MQLRELMTAGVVTAGEGDEVLKIARLMRDRGVGSVVICDPDGGPVAMITDRDVAIRIAADDRSLAEPVGPHASRPLITGEPDMDLEVAQRMTANVIEGALPDFYFHERG